MTKQALDIGWLGDLNLANVVNETEGLAWRLRHDAPKHPEENIDPAVRKLMQTRDKSG